MANSNKALEAVDCHIHSVRYDMAVNRDTVGRLIASSGRLRRCSIAHTSNQCLSRDKDASILSWPTLMSHQKLWIAIFTAMPMTLSQRRYEQTMLEPMADTLIKSLSKEAVDCDIHGVRYDMVLECCLRPPQIGPHLVIYDVVLALIRPEELERDKDASILSLSNIT
eukprot:scaffold7606_cov105-Skeletonema_dohrnii-CCMP3373.AAC.1